MEIGNASNEKEWMAPSIIPRRASSTQEGNHAKILMVFYATLLMVFYATLLILTLSSSLT
jgi:hypothetical protein